MRSDNITNVNDFDLQGKIILCQVDYFLVTGTTLHLVEK